MTDGNPGEQYKTADDLIDYIYSLPSFSDIQDLPRETLRTEILKNMHDGVLHVPKDYGMFIARKG